MANIIFQFSVLSIAVFTTIGVQALGPAAVGGIGSPCDGISKLCGSNQVCYSSICQCDDDHVEDINQRICLERTKEWEGSCTDDNQCKGYTDAFCNNGNCDCRAGFHYEDSKCWTTRRLNEECGNDHECLLLPHSNRIECSAGLCSCKDGFQITDTGDDCSGASELGKVGLPVLLLIHIIKSLLV